MYIIAVCDDEEKELDRIEAFLIRYRDVKQTLVYQVERFASAEELLERVREEDYVPDLLLLDIFMSGMSGIEAAKEMRRLGHDMPIIFLTTSTDFALDAYRVDAIQYLVKPLNQERFFRALDSAIGQSYKIKESQIAIKVAGGIRQIQPNDIVYCEYSLIHG